MIFRQIEGELLHLHELTSKLYNLLAYVIDQVFALFQRLGRYFGSLLLGSNMLMVDLLCLRSNL